MGKNSDNSKRREYSEKEREQDESERETSKCIRFKEGEYLRGKELRVEEELRRAKMRVLQCVPRTCE